MIRGFLEAHGIPDVAPIALFALVAMFVAAWAMTRRPPSDLDRANRAIRARAVTRRIAELRPGEIVRVTGRAVAVGPMLESLDTGALVLARFVSLSVMQKDHPPAHAKGHTHPHKHAHAHAHVVSTDASMAAFAIEDDTGRIAVVTSTARVPQGGGETTEGALDPSNPRHGEYVAHQHVKYPTSAMRFREVVWREGARLTIIGQVVRETSAGDAPDAPLTLRAPTGAADVILES